MNGILLINKPKNYTSHDIVAIVKKISKEKVGHTGTLDPNATGVLPLLIGKATEISKYLVNHDKTYIATIKLGIKTDTADAEGTIIEKREVLEYSEEEIENALKKMLGKQNQIPPMYSAIKVNGKKLYEYAREGKHIKLEPRQIEIYNIKLIQVNKQESEITFEVACSKGTYIRTLCENIAEALGTIGYMKELNRTKVGEFSIENTVKIEDIKNNENLLKENIISIEEFFENSPKIELNLFLNGVILNKNDLSNNLYKIYNQNKFIGIGIAKDGKLKRDVILQEN